MNPGASVKVLSKSSSRQSRSKHARDQLQTDRRNQRENQFFASRGLATPKENAIKTRTQLMEEFKQKKLQQKLDAQKKKLPPFRAGIVHHSLDSPYKYFNRKDSDSITSVSGKPFKLITKPKFKALKITIPYSPKFSRTRAHETCFNNRTIISKNCAIATNSTNRGLSARNQPVPSRSISSESILPSTARATRQTLRNIESLANSTNEKQKSVKENQVSKTKRNSRQKSGIKDKIVRHENNTQAGSDTQNDRAVNTRGRKITFDVNEQSNDSQKFSLERMKKNSAEPKEMSKVFQFTSKPSVETKSEPKTKSPLQNVFSFRVPTFSNLTCNTDTLDSVEPSEGNMEERTKTSSSGSRDATVMSGCLSPRSMSSFLSSPMPTDEVNDSIEIPDHFVKRKISKDSLRMKCLITPLKESTATPPLFGVEFQRRRLNEERNILQRTCYLWQDKLAEYKDIPSDVRDDIDCVLGQTRLLTSDKFEQMARLIDQFENQDNESEAKSGELRLLENDLDSFWDMMYIQVDQMYKKFEHLKRLEKYDWVDKEEEKKENDTGTKKGKVKLRKPVSVKIGATSKIADFIRNKRNQSKADCQVQATKEFDGGFFKVESPLSKKMKSKDPQSGEGIPVAKSILKTNMSSLNIISMSPLAKSVASSVVDIVTTPSNETRGILKKSDKSSGKSKHTGTKKICFSIAEPHEDIFATPLKSPCKMIRKTPHKFLTPSQSKSNNNTTLELDSMTLDQTTPSLTSTTFETSSDVEGADLFNNVSVLTPSALKSKSQPNNQSPIDPAFLPRKSPRLSKTPVRFSFADFEKKLVLDDKKIPRVSAKRTPKTNSSKKKFVLRPSKLPL